MHSKNFRSLVLLALVSFVAAPAASFADRPVGAAEMTKRMYELDETIARLKKQIAENTKTIKNSEELFKANQSLREELRQAEKDVTDLPKRLEQGTKLYQEVFHDETEVENILIPQRDALVESIKGKKKHLVTREEEKIVALNSKIGRIQKRTERNLEKYKDVMGVEMPSRTGSPVTAEEKPTPPAPAPVDVAKLKKLDGCYDLNQVTTKTVYTYYRIGEADIKNRSPSGKDPGGNPEEKAIAANFENQAKELSDFLDGEEYGKISGIETTSYTSNVQFTSAPDKAKASRELAERRSIRAVSNLYDELMLNGKPMGSTRTEEYRSERKPAAKHEIGPSWKSGEFQRLSKLPVTDADLTEAAKAVLDPANTDPTPVRVTSEDSPEKNLEATKAKLKECCAANRGTLKFQPYQFSAMKVSMPKFTPNSEACVQDAAKVSVRTSTKKPDPINPFVEGATPGVPGSRSNDAN